MNYRLLLFAAAILFTIPAIRASAQQPDTIVVQTLTLDSIGRAGVYQFPDTGSFEKIIMQYTMRCHNALVSNGTKTEQGCGQWDYNCETYLWDSTRTDSLQNIAPSAIVSNYPTSTNFPYTKVGTHSITRIDQKRETSPLCCIQEWGAGSPNNSHPVGFQKQYQRHEFLLPAKDPIWAGLKKSASIAGITLSTVSQIDFMHDLRIRARAVKAGSWNISTAHVNEDSGFVELYHQGTSLDFQPDYLMFYKPLIWDSTSDIIMDISYSGLDVTTGIQLYGSDSASLVTSTNTQEHALSFAGSEFVPVPSASLNQIHNQITIAFWAYGDTNYLPGTNCVFAEGLDNAGHRQINIHLPWSDGNVYWDCGGDSLGNFDRIQNTATKRQSSGQWNHWVFTKDAMKGIMSIYLNGSLWVRDTGTHRPINATEMLLGGAASSGIGYYGDVRQFAIWNSVLDSNQIEQVMMRDSAILPLQPIT